METGTEKRAKLFKNGQSQAVRLPKAFRFVGTEVRIRRVKEGVLLEPVVPQIGAGDWDSVRKVLKTAGSLDVEMSARVEGAMQKLQKEVAIKPKPVRKPRVKKTRTVVASAEKAGPLGFALGASLKMADL
jgi:antitoxin VapB